MIFKCTQCGAKFEDADIEYYATVYSVPQKCPKCGSIRTRPISLLGGLTDGGVPEGGDGERFGNIGK